MTGITLVATIVFGRNPRCHLDAIVQFTSTKISPFLVHGQMTIIFVVSVGLFACAEFVSAVFDPTLIKLGHVLYHMSGSSCVP